MSATLAHRVALAFEDGVTRFIEARPGDTVADAAYRAGVNIPLDCRDGACGTCRCKVESGSFDPGSYIEEALSEEEAAEGFALACQMRPKSDLVLGVLASSAACKVKAAPFKAALLGVERLSPSTLAFALEGPKGFAFLPGQYVNIRVPGTDQRRSYSMASAPGDSRLSFLVRDIPDGLMSGWLRAAQPGAEVEVEGPSGSFYLRAPERPALFLSGGTGLAPFLSMLEALAASGAPLAHPVRLVHGVTTDADLVEVARLEALAARLPGFSFATTVADAAASAHARTGYVTAHVAAEELFGGEVDIYLCGPPPMVDAVRSWLSGLGVAPRAFHTERFSPSGQAGGTAVRKAA